MHRKQKMGLKQNVKEQRYYGVNACRAIWELRREEITRVFLLEPRKRDFGSLLKWCAQTKRPYRFVSAEDMEKITSSTHHEGVCIQAKKREALEFDEFEKKDFQLLDGLIIYLDGIENPHNLGSILRIAAHFDVSLVLGQKGRIPTLAAATCRIAEGGAEFVAVAETKDPLKALKTLQKRGYILVGTASQASKPLFKHRFSPKSVVILGSERRGVSSEIGALAEETIFIPGSGAIESLNVAAACAVVLAEQHRQLKK